MALERGVIAERAETALVRTGSPPRGLRILHVIANLDPRRGGPATALLPMCRAVARRGHAVTVMTTNASGARATAVPLDKSVIDQGVEIRYFPLQLRSRYSVSLPMADGLRRAIPGFDVVHIHSLYIFHTLVASYLCRRSGVPYLIRPHGTLDPFLRRKNRLVKAVYTGLFERRNLDGAAAIHYTSRDELELARPVGIKAPGVVVPLGIDPDAYDRLPPPGHFRAKYPRLADRQLVVFLGRLTPKKGLDLLVPAFARVIEQNPAAHLVLAGPDDEGYGNLIRGWLQKLRIEQHAIFTGLLLGDEKLALLRDADVWVLPSYTENFGMAVVEAMACGLPIVISDRVNIYREIRDAGAGMVVPCSTDHVADAIARVLADDDLRRSLGAAALDLARSAFTWDAAAEQLEQVYLAVARRAPGGAPPASRAVGPDVSKDGI